MAMVTLVLLLLSKTSNAFTLNDRNITITYSYRYITHTIILLASILHHDTVT